MFKANAFLFFITHLLHLEYIVLKFLRIRIYKKTATDGSHSRNTISDAEYMKCYESLSIAESWVNIR